MPAPSQRRSAVRRSGSTNSSVRAVSQKSATEDDLPVQVPEGGEDSSAALPSASAVSGRRSASRRGAGSSARGPATSGRTSARRPLTPEEQAKRRAAMRSMLKVVGGVAALLIVAAILVLFVFKKDPQLEAARSHLAALDSGMSRIASRADYDAATKSLAEIPDLPEVAARKSELKKALADLEPQIQKSEREARVTENRKVLMAQLAKLTDSSVDLDKLAIDCMAFVKNPVDPSAAPNEAYAKEFDSAVNDIQVRLASVETERGRRDAAATTGASQRAQLEVEALVKEEKFAAAQQVIADTAAKFPKSDLSRVRRDLNDALESRWNSVKVYVENRYQDYAAPGITQSLRQKALEEARARLDGVIANWGVETYVNQAKELRAKY
jgi:hypothetical protein